MTFDEKIAAFAARLQEERTTNLKAKYPQCEDKKTSVVPGNKYTKVDYGTSGMYMVVNETGEIFGIKAYGVIHRGHAYGTLDTIADWDWSGYKAVRKLDP